MLLLLKKPFWAYLYSFKVSKKWKNCLIFLDTKFIRDKNAELFADFKTMKKV
jgi:hypothetical protein